MVADKQWCCMLVALPLHYLILTSGFGYRLHPVTGQYAFHAGIDLRAHKDTVYAVLPGLVSACDYNPFLGVHIRLKSGELTCSYGHLSQIFVLPGDSILAGTPIGITGATGRVTGEHLHFSVQHGRSYLDPLCFLFTIANNLKQQNKENKK